MKLLTRKESLYGFLFAFIAVVMLSLAACGNSETASTNNETNNNQNESANESSGPQYGGKLTVGMAYNARNLGFPADPSGNSTIWYYQPTIEAMGRYDKNGEIEPLLAESWETDPDAATITFKLKEGIKFHDGTDFNAEAAKWNIEQFMEFKRVEVEGVKSVEVVDEYTIKVHLEEWNSNLLESIAYYVGMVSPTAVEENGVEWAIGNPVGTGPFKLKEWKHDVSFSLVKNEDYWQEGKPYLDEIEILMITDYQTLANVFKSGEADTLQTMRPDTYFELERTGNYKFNRSIGVYGGIGIGIHFESDDPNSPFSDIRVRRAVMHAIDSKTITESILRGQANPTNQYYPEWSKFYNEEIKGYEYDPELAKQLLAEAGYPNGFKTEITVDTPRRDDYTAVQSYLAEIGIDVEIKAVETGQLFSKYVDGTWEDMISYLRPLQPSAGVLLPREFSSYTARFDGKIKRFPELDEAFDAINNARTAEEQIAAIKEADRLLIDEFALYHSMYENITNLAYHPKVHNFGMMTTNSFDWHPEDVWIEQ